MYAGTARIVHGWFDTWITLLRRAFFAWMERRGYRFFRQRLPSMYTHRHHTRPVRNPPTMPRTGSP